MKPEKKPLNNCYGDWRGREAERTERVSIIGGKFLVANFMWLMVLVGN